MSSQSAHRAGPRDLVQMLRWASVAGLYALARASPVWPAVERDMKRHIQPRLDLPLPGALTRAEITSALRHRPLRSILYARLEKTGPAWDLMGSVLSVFLRGAPALEVIAKEFGGGMNALHGIASVIGGKHIGEDFLFAQQVTIGFDDRGGSPWIGDRVRVGAGAAILGPITVGDDAVIGAGAVVVKDVPAGAVVGGVPARVIENATDRYSARRASSED